MATAAAPSTQLPKAQVLQLIDELRDWFRDYADLIEAGTDGVKISGGKQALLEFHRERLQNGHDPRVSMEQLLGLLKGMLEGIHKDPLVFRIPTHSAVLPESDNPRLAEMSAQLRAMGDRLDPYLAQAGSGAGIGQPGAAQAGESRAQSLQQAMVALFKGMVRQDWADVNLVLNHINLVTTSSKSQGLVREMGQIARDIFNSLDEFSKDLTIEELTHSAQDIPDAVYRLTSVIDRLEQFAHASLDELEQLIEQGKANQNAVEETLALVEECAKELDDLERSRPELAAMLAEARELLRPQVGEPLRHLQSRIQEDNRTFLALISNMSFQDLTGQTLKKVIEFIERLQSQLVGLISKHQRKSTAPAQSEQAAPPGGPDAKARDPMNQHSVDKMLADLGF